jgi:uncharacterized membrane protein YeaQ/YmgE (transglycosylase-associated protein family)
MTKPPAIIPKQTSHHALARRATRKNGMQSATIAWLTPCLSMDHRAREAREATMEILVLSAIGLAVGAVTSKMVPWKRGVGTVFTLGVGVMGAYAGACVSHSMGYGPGAPPLLVAAALTAFLFVYVYFAAKTRRTES